MYEFTDVAAREAFRLLCSEQIGEGNGRKVFSSLIIPDCVIKVEEASKSFQNIIEWQTWEHVRGTPFSRWFAECKMISPNGLVLIMERTRPASDAELLHSLPLGLGDFKRSNYGMVKSVTKGGSPGKEYFVCHDYGTNLLPRYGMTQKMQKVVWLNQ